MNEPRSDPSSKMTSLEIRIASTLGGIFSLRMLGLFMILPVFALFAENLPGTTPTLIGVALGVYGLTQACLQIPFGMLSDRFGRKPIITIGLLIFALGSIVAALSTDIFGIIIGRAIQGAGAIGSTIMALIADSSRAEQRSKAMAIMGMIIGLSFLVAMTLGPLLNHWIGVTGIFWFTAVLALLGIFILHRFIPTPQHETFHRDTELEPARLREIISNSQLLRLDVGILVLHGVLTASFIAIPLALQNNTGINSDHLWYLYGPILLFSFLAMLPWLLIAERKHWVKPVFLGAIGVLLVSEILLSLFANSLTNIVIFLFLFFAAFSFLEANLPSLISRLAPASSKGTAMGVYSSSQFLGMFIGGILGGLLYEHFGVSGVFMGCAGLIALWLIFALSMNKPQQVTNYMLNLGSLSPQKAQDIKQQLLAIAGVIEVTVMVDDGIAYLKIDNNRINKNELHKFSMA